MLPLTKETKYNGGDFNEVEKYVAEIAKRVGLRYVKEESEFSPTNGNPRLVTRTFGKVVGGICGINNSITDELSSCPEEGVVKIISWDKKYKDKIERIAEELKNEFDIIKAVKIEESEFLLSFDRRFILMPQSKGE